MTVLSQIVDENGRPFLLTQDSAGAPIVEPLGGYNTVEDVLDRFPETVYNTNRDSHLYSFLQALCGETGVGSLKKVSYVQRLQIEGNAINFAVLDNLFGSSFQFPRLPEEIYPWNPDTDVLTVDEWDQVAAADESYRNRVSQFMQSTRLGNAPDGIAGAASAAANINCDALENYVAKYDALSDDPQGRDYPGLTDSASEFVIVALTDANSPTYQSQIVPTAANTAPTWQATTSYVFGDVVQPSTPNGHFYSVITPADGTIGVSGSTEPTWVTDGTTNTSGSVTFQDMGASSFSDYITTAAAGDPSQAVTSVDPAIQRNVLYVLDSIRPANTLVTMYPDSPHLVPITMGDFSTPVTPTPGASSTEWAISRFVTGSANVVWPTPDNQTAVINPATENTLAPANRTNGYFIVADVENEQNQMPLSNLDRMNIYETIQITRAYTEAALTDLTYNTPDFYNVPTNLGKYKSEHKGSFYDLITSIYPFLRSVPTNTLFDSSKAVSPQFSPVVLQINPLGS